MGVLESRRRSEETIHDHCNFHFHLGGSAARAPAGLRLGSYVSRKRRSDVGECVGGCPRRRPGDYVVA